MFVVVEAYKMYQAPLKIPSTTSHTHTPQSFPTRPTEPFAELAQRATITDAHAQCLLHWVAPKCRLHSLDFRLGCTHDECCSRSASKRSSEYFKTNRCRVNDGTTEQNSKYIPSFLFCFCFCRGKIQWRLGNDIPRCHDLIPTAECILVILSFTPFL